MVIKLQVGKGTSCPVLLQINTFMYFSDVEILEPMIYFLLLLLGWWSEGFEACVMTFMQPISLSGVCQDFSPLHCRSQDGC